MNVPFLDLVAQHRPLKDELLSLWGEILDSCSFVGGEQVSLFEEEFARFCATRYCVSVNSGTDALRFIFIALGVTRGDEVITVPNTFIATSEAISQAGATPVFVDVDPKTYTMNPAKISERITPKTRGIVPVHLYGQTADMDAIGAIAEKHGVWVVEDACQAHGACFGNKKAGSIGSAAAFSFYPGKNMGACGEAGAVTTNNEDLAQKIKMLRDHGQQKKYHHAMEGYNGRCDAIQAAALRVKLRHIETWNALRLRNAQRYRDRLKGLSQVVLPFAAQENRHVFHLFVVLVKNRDAVAEMLRQKGVATGLHYPVPLHLQTTYVHLGLKRGSFPVSEYSAQHGLSLPMYPELTFEQIDYVCDCLEEAVLHDGT